MTSPCREIVPCKRKGDPWTDHQVSLAVIAVLLGFSCIVVFTAN